LNQYGQPAFLSRFHPNSALLCGPYFFKQIACHESRKSDQQQAPNSLFKNDLFAACPRGQAPYEICSKIGMYCSPGAPTERLFLRAAKL